MQQLIMLHGELAGLEQEKVRRITEQDWQGLEQQLELSRAVLQQIEDVERRRQELVERLVGNPEKALSDVAAQLPDARGEELLKQGKKLRTLILELKALTLHSEQLISSSLEVVDFTLSLFSGNNSMNKTYDGDGGERGEGQGSLSLVFDVKA
jgi:flagellar biosynthesis/type III secretory pathway chaperone